VGRREEIVHKVNKAREGPKRVRTLTPFRPFPVEALPGPAAEFVRQGALALGCDPSYLALFVLPVLASAIGNSRTIRLKRGWTEPALVWSAVVGDSGTLKTPAFQVALGYLFERQRRLKQEHDRKAAEYQNEMLSYRERQKAKGGEGVNPGDAPEEPRLLRIVTTDTTIEKLAEILENNPRGLVLARDELACWLGSFTRYKGKAGGTDAPHWLELFRAGDLIIDRKTAERRTVFVRRGNVSVTGGIQPVVLARALTQDLLDCGLGSRLLLAMPPRLAKRWTELEIVPDVRRSYESLLEGLFGLQMAKDRRGDLCPRAVRLSPEAKGEWVAFYDDWAQEQAAAEGELAAAFSKLEGYAARFALIHHVADRVARLEEDSDPVGAASVRAGVTLCRWFAAEARRVYATLSESEDERATRRLVEWVQARGGRITTRDLQRSNSHKWPTAGAAQAALDGLAEADLGAWVERPGGARGGHPIRELILLPTDDTSDTCPPEGPGVRPGPSDTTSDTTGGGGKKPIVSGASVGSVICRTEGEGCLRNGDQPGGGSVGGKGQVSDEGPPERRGDGLEWD
jgi:hypothetical protein